MKPLESWTMPTAQSPPSHGGSPSRAAGAGAAAGGGVPEVSASLTVRPGKYCLRSGVPHVAGATATSTSPTFVTYNSLDGGDAALGSGGAEQAIAAPWTVLQSSGHKFCTFATAKGLKLFCYGGGVLSVGEPPRPELAQFIMVADTEHPTAADGRERSSASSDETRRSIGRSRCSSNPCAATRISSLARRSSTVGGSAMIGSRPSE